MENHDEFSWTGPKGFDEAQYYKDKIHSLGTGRADHQIEGDALEALERAGVEIEDISLRIKDGFITISGTVPDEQMAIDAESAIYHLSGVKGIKNHLRH